MRSHFLIAGLTSCTTRFLLRKSLPVLISYNAFPTFSQSVSGLKLRSLIHLNLNFVQGKTIIQFYSSTCGYPVIVSSGYLHKFYTRSVQSQSQHGWERAHEVPFIAEEFGQFGQLDGCQDKESKFSSGKWSLL